MALGARQQLWGLPVGWQEQLIMSAAIFVMIVAWGGILQSKKWAAGLESLRLLLRVCLEAGFDSEKCQFFDETRRLFEERTLRYPAFLEKREKKQR